MDKLKELQLAIRTDNKTKVDEIKGDCSRFISRTVKPEELDSLREDTLASVLISQSSVDRANGKHIRTLQTTGNGNCLYNCVSIWFTGNESLHVYLQMLTAIELYENAVFYTQHLKVLSVQSLLKVGEDTLFRQILSSNGTSSMNENASVPDFIKFTAAIKDEAIGTCKLSEYAALVHIMALSSVIQYPIRSHYPDVKAVIPSQPFDAVYFPRQSGSYSSSNELVVNVLWSCDGQLDNTPNRKFEPNHFVPLQFVDKESVGKRNEKVSKSNAGEMSRNPKQVVLPCKRKIDVEDSADVP